MKPVVVKANKGVVGPDHLVLCDGEHTYQIKLKELYAIGVLPSLITAWRLHLLDEDRLVHERLRDTEKTTVKTIDLELPNESDTGM